MAILICRNFPLTVTTTHTDPLGRFIGIEGSFEAKQYAVFSIYVPHQCPQDTFRALQSLLLRLPHRTVLIGGDFNTVPNPTLDTSGGSHTSRSTQSAHLLTWAETLGLCDIGRIWHPNLQAYTHTSASHGSQYQIDQFWTPATDSHWSDA